MKKKKNLVNLVLMALLTALMVVLQLLPIIRVGPFLITFLTIPVAIGAMLLGSGGGAFLGAVFGVTMAIVGIATGEGAVYLSTSPWRYFVLCILPRILVGFLAGVIFTWVGKIEKAKIFNYFLTGFLTPLLNTVLFLSALFLLYSNTVLAGTPFFVFIGSALTFNAVIEMIVGLVITPPIGLALNAAKRNIVRAG